MQRNDVVKGVFIAVPMAVLCILYGLWLVMDTPAYVESMIVGGVILLLYALAFGSEEAWAISFLTLDVPEPEWYSDEIEGHAYSNLRLAPTTIDYARDLRSFIRSFENN